MRQAQSLAADHRVGFPNILSLETDYNEANPLSDAQSLLPCMVKRLKRRTLDTVRDALNKWYAAHGDQLNRPIIEAVWLEMVVPGFRKFTQQARSRAQRPLGATKVLLR